MSSREIAELTGKRHDNVLVDIKKTLADLGEDVLKFQGIYSDSMNRSKIEYLLPKRETMILVSGYSVVLRARIVDRWMKLQEAAAICMEVMQLDTSFRLNSQLIGVMP